MSGPDVAGQARSLALWQAYFPQADPAYVRAFHDLHQTARRFHRATGRHLDIFGELGELYAALMLNLRLHRPNAQGADGRVGNDFVEVKTISPSKRVLRVPVNMNGNFNRLMIVRFDARMHVSHRLLARSALPRGGGRVFVSWPEAADGDGG